VLAGRGDVGVDVDGEEWRVEFFNWYYVVIIT
jgi:hypothetical protein